MCYYWYSKTLKRAQLVQDCLLDGEDFESHQPIFVYGFYSCTWTLIDPVRFSGRNTLRQKFPFFSCTAKHYFHHTLHRQYLVTKQHIHMLANEQILIAVMDNSKLLTFVLLGEGSSYMFAFESNYDLRFLVDVNWDELPPQHPCK